MPYHILDPMRRDYRGRENEPGIAAEIVRLDEQDIADSTLVLVNAIRPSWGTAMELRYAHTLGRLTLTVCPSPAPSPWLVYHSTWLVPDFDAAIARIRYQFEPIILGTAWPTIYLCGGINGLSDTDCRDWREYVKAALL